MGTSLGGAASHASAFQIEARTEAQAYQIRAWRGSTPDDPVLLPRRRIVQYLGLNAFELATGQDLGFESNMRIWADFGLPKGDAARVDGLKSEDAELLHAFVRYANGGFEGRLGRQLYTDVGDTLAFDGARVRYVSRLGLGAELYGGLWVKGAGFLGSSVYQPDGTRESDSRRLDAGVVGADPSLDAMEPLVGAKLLLENVKGFNASAGYRKALSDGKTDIERATVEARYGQGLGLNVLAGLDYDLLLGKPAQARAQVRWDATRVAVSVEAMRLSPVLSADSIWYYFAWAPRDEARLRVDVFPVGLMRFYVQGQGSKYNEDVNPDMGIAAQVDAEGAPKSTNVGGSAGGAYRAGAFRSSLDVTYQTGYGGDQLWADLSGGYTFDRALLTLDARVSFARVSDSFNPRLTGNFYGAQVWASRALTRAARLSLVVEQNINPFTDSDTKGFLLFDLKASL
ncbi:hypothetical protein LZ198_31595 [Myxococcus sp. K15C18031901]|uniref:hypothetical protein n=1 Tax=Myxococcus dinghuensis TaxID=2906761 RepID=UPI0020A80EAD|nr:hypothetical protein [Myxococcus dinghuensis]MCP3103437.1 hypothetical protein [Myxococcus dinghuensis]